MSLLKLYTAHNVFSIVHTPPEIPFLRYFEGTLSRHIELLGTVGKWLPFMTFLSCESRRSQQFSDECNGLIDNVIWVLWHKNVYLYFVQEEQTLCRLLLSNRGAHWASFWLIWICSPGPSWDEVILSYTIQNFAFQPPDHTQTSIIHLLWSPSAENLVMLPNTPAILAKIAKHSALF